MRRNQWNTAAAVSNAALSYSLRHCWVYSILGCLKGAQRATFDIKHCSAHFADLQMWPQVFQLAILRWDMPCSSCFWAHHLSLRRAKGQSGPLEVRHEKMLGVRWLWSIDQETRERTCCLLSHASPSFTIVFDPLIRIVVERCRRNLCLWHLGFAKIQCQASLLGFIIYKGIANHNKDTKRETATRTAVCVRLFLCPCGALYILINDGHVGACISPERWEGNGRA